MGRPLRAPVSLQRSGSALLTAAHAGVRRRFRAFIDHAAFAGLFFFLVVFNSAILATERHPPLDANLQEGADTANVVLTAVFTVELVLKLVALPLREFRADGWNLFDSVVAILSLVEMGLGDGGGSAISAMRSCRLLRVFKLARNVISLRILLTVLAKATVGCASFCCVTCLFLYIYTLFGMQLFANMLEEAENGRPLLHFDDPVAGGGSCSRRRTPRSWASVLRVARR